MEFESFNIIVTSNNIKNNIISNLITEEPLLIKVNDEELATVMRTPGNDRELAVGFLFSEGIIKKVDDIQMVSSQGADAEESNNLVNIKLKDGIKIDKKERSYEVRTSCGVCGRKKIDELFEKCEFVSGSIKVRIENIYRMPDIMSGSQLLSQKTRGAHCAAFFTADAEMIGSFEDVGRHNALDKLIGHCLIAGIRMDDKALILSGRTSYEMLAKALYCGVGIVGSISAPSSLAVQIAKRGGIALAGMIRGDSMNIYNKAECFLSE